MRFLYVIVFLFLSIQVVAGSYVSDEVLVQYTPSGMSLFSQDATVASLDVEVVPVEEGESVEQAILRLQNEPGVLHVQPNYVYTSYSLPNDPLFGQQWALHNIGQTVDGFAGTPGSDISWLSGFALFSGIADQTVTGTLIALIDDGVNYNHVDLTGQFWDGTNCLSHTGAPLGGCTVGYDFYDDDLDPLPNPGDHHGTHIAGVIAAKINNSIGIAGVNPNARIMALRAGSGNTLATSDIIKAIHFAQHNGARIINASFGGSVNDPALYTAMQNFPGIIITAAGNGTNDGVGFEITIPGSPIYPCAFDLGNVLCVAATDAADEITEYSNFSNQYVELAAPCSKIIGTYGFNQYAFADGTSSSVPLTVGIASLAWSMYPDASYEQIVDSIISGAVYITGLEDKTLYSSRVDLYGSLLYMQNTYLPSPFTFAAETGALPNTLYTSNIVTITGVAQSIPVSIDNGEYRVNGVSWTGSTGTISSGDTLQVRMLSSWEPDLTDEVIVTVGGYSTAFSVTTMQSGLVEGQSIVLSGGRYHNTTTGLDIVIEADSGTDYRVFGHRFVGEYTGVLLSGENVVSPVFDGSTGVSYVGVVLGTGQDVSYYSTSVIYDTTPPELTSFSIASGQTVYGTSVLVTGTVSDDFALSEVSGMDMDCDYTGSDITTCDFSGELSLESGNYTVLLYLHDKAGNLDILSFPVYVDIWDRTPDAFSFTAQNGVTRSTSVESNTITIAGIDTGVDISIIGGQYKIGTGSYTSATGTVVSGDTVQLSLTTSSSYSAVSTAILMIGWGSGSWSVTTQSAPPPPPSGCCGGGEDPIVNDDQEDNDTDDEEIESNTGETEEVVYELFDTTSVTPLSSSSLTIPKTVTCATPDELQLAYTYAYGIGITTMPTATQARLCDGVTRAELAKMIVSYAVTIGNLEVDTSRSCAFDDIGSQPADLQAYIVQACQLGIMGVGIDSFSPNMGVDRGQFGTTLSRVLYGDTHNGGQPYYIDHLNALNSNGIITNTNPSLIELRGYVMLMMMRAVN